MPRTENDTWNLATSVGATATLVAAARAIATKDENPVIADRFAEPLVRAVGVDFFTRWAAGDLNAVDVDYEGSSWKLEHMPDAMAVRTRFFDGFFRDATDAGIRQAVILASGLDSRAYRLDWPAGTTVYEIDQPEVIEFKTVTLDGLGAAPTADRRTVAVDLRQDWPAALTAAGLDKAEPTAWIAEGLFGYLPPDAQDRLLDDITALSAPGSRLACEVMPNRPDIDKEAVRETMRAASAKWAEHGLHLDFSELGFEGERKDAAVHLGELGWSTVGRSLGELLADAGRGAIPRGDDGVSIGDTNYYTSMLAK